MNCWDESTHDSAVAMISRRQKAKGKNKTPNNICWRKHPPKKTPRARRHKLERRCFSPKKTNGALHPSSSPKRISRRSNHHIRVTNGAYHSRLLVPKLPARRGRPTYVTAKARTARAPCMYLFALFAIRNNNLLGGGGHLFVYLVNSY